MYREILLDAPDIGEGEKIYVNKALDSGYVSTVGPFVPEFENKFAVQFNLKMAVSTQSGTAALHMALHELRIGKGDEVIVPALTFIATANPIMYVGAKPVFVDSDINTWNIDVKKIEEKITKKTKAIIPVHLYGNPCDMEEIMAIAKRNNLYVIEDATESLGALYKGSYTGSIGDLGCFSFNGNKTITTGGGGMIVGSQEERIVHIKYLVNQARDASRGYYHSEIGFNYRMTNIEAALGLAQMERFEEFFDKKQRFNGIYRDKFKDIDSLKFQEEYKGAKSSWWLTCVSFDKDINVQDIQLNLKKKGVPTRRVFTPITMFPPYRDNENDICDNAMNIYKKSLCLPGSTLNSEENILKVCEAIRLALGEVGS